MVVNAHHCRRLTGKPSFNVENTLKILGSYLERAVKDELNIAEVLNHIFAEEALAKRRRAYEKQVQMSGFRIKKTMEDLNFSFQPSIDKCQIEELTTKAFESGTNSIRSTGSHCAKKSFNA